MTFAVAATIAAVDVANAAQRCDKGAKARPVLALAGGISVAVPVITLALGIYAGCTDTGLALRFRTLPLASAPITVIGWFALIYSLFRSAGIDSPNSAARSGRIFIVALPIALVEFYASAIVIHEYCNDKPSWMYAHLAVAAASSALAFAVLRRR